MTSPLQHHRDAITRPDILAGRWWETRWFVFAAIIAAAVPLLWPTVPPLTDLLGHLGRYRVQLDIAHNPHLREWYAFHWQLIGNLGVDLLVIPLSKLFGLELAVKLIVIAIPVTMVGALLMIAREVHGRVPATALFALPLAYCYPFHYGFANFALSMSLALVALVPWLRLGRQRRDVLRAALFVPISCVVWLCHAYGWGLLGLLAFSAELARRFDRRPASVIRAALACVPLCFPAVLMAIWRGGDVGGSTVDWFNMSAKLIWVFSVLRDRWEFFDLISACGLFFIVLAALPAARVRFSGSLGIGAALLAATFILMPRMLFGSAYADMRLAPYALAIALIALKPREPSLHDTGRQRPIAWITLAFCLARLVGTTASLVLYDAHYDRELAALDQVPIGARLISFVGTPCDGQWDSLRILHLPGLALERRLAYANDQWALPGAQLLSLRYTAAGKFIADPSEGVVRDGCAVGSSISHSLSTFPREAFDYVWLIDPPPYRPDSTRDLVPIWRSGSSVLFRIDHHSSPVR